MLSARDPRDEKEGSLDPLGLAGIAEHLAIKLVPGVRERMRHPRFLTIIAAGFDVCRDFDAEAVAADRASPPWMVFEWMVVEGLVRTKEGLDTFTLPGSDKAANAVSQGVPLSAARYLKSPFVFGFHGVYRALARDTGIDLAGYLGETGQQLLEAWSMEQGLSGFIGTKGGYRSNLKNDLASAVEAGMTAGAVARKSLWHGWREIRKHLAPDRIGKRERSLLRKAMLAQTAGGREELLRFLCSPEGQEAYQRNGERGFYKALQARASAILKPQVTAILFYEQFARLCQDAFDDALVAMTRSVGVPVTPSQLAGLATVKKAAKEAPGLFRDVLEALSALGLASRFSEGFARLGERGSAADWAERLLAHHMANQERKLPDGKSPWFERYDDGRVMVRPLYRRENGARRDLAFVHGYRCRPLQSFATDLNMLP